MSALCLLAAGLLAAWIGLRDARTARVLPAECLLLCVFAAAPAITDGAGRMIAMHALGLLAALAALGAALPFTPPGALPRGDWIGLASLGWAAGWSDIAWVLAAGGVLSLAIGAWQRRRALRRRGLGGALLRTRAPLLPGFALTTAGVLWTSAAARVLDGPSLGPPP